MAKALLGHVGGPDPCMLSTLRRLRQRVRDLEAEIVRMQEENDILAAQAGQHAAPRSAIQRSAHPASGIDGWPPLSAAGMTVSPQSANRPAGCQQADLEQLRTPAARNG